MPAYLLHGFRWIRASFAGVRVFIVLQNLDDAAAEYIQQPETTHTLLSAMHRLFPDIMTRLPELRFIEQHDPEDIYSDTAVSQPYAYVADKVITIAENHGTGKLAEVLSVDLEELMQSYTDDTAISDLRDMLCPGQKVGWYMVYNGDPDRGYPDSYKTFSHDQEEEEEEGIGVGDGEGDVIDKVDGHERTGSGSLDSHSHNPMATTPGKSTVSQPLPRNACDLLPIEKATGSCLFSFTALTLSVSILAWKGESSSPETDAAIWQEGW